MIRTQIQLREDQSVRLQRLAGECGCSVAELIRRSVDRFLERKETPGDCGSRLSALVPVGCGHSGSPDVSARHDHYLAQALLGEGEKRKRAR